MAGHTGTRGVSYAKAPNGQAIALHGRPQLVNPVAGVAGAAGSGGAASAQPSSQPSEVSVSSTRNGKSLPQPVSESKVLAELTASGISPNPNRATMTPGQLAIAPINAPASVQAVINAGNEIAHLPYIWGGGHETFEDTGYDCSGSLSFILAAAGLLNTTETSGELMSYGDRGPGKWITIFASAGSHVRVHRRPALRHGRAGRDRLALVEPFGRRARPEQLRGPASARALAGLPTREPSFS